MAELSVKGEKDKRQKLPLAIYLASHGIHYKSACEKIYTSERTFYYRNAHPSTMLFVEAVRIAKLLDIAVEELITDLKKHDISFG